MKMEILLTNLDNMMFDEELNKIIVDDCILAVWKILD
jgi:hypothetical protein